MDRTPHAARPELKRTLGLLALTAFGVGDILGAGVYGLIGKIAGLAGSAAWMTYVLAGVMAALTGLTYAEWTARQPRAGGAAHFCETAFRAPVLTFLVIVAVTLSGLFSMATAARIFASYALAGAHVAPWVQQSAVPVVVVAALALVAARGIQISSVANVICTTIELSGLFIILLLGARFLGSVNYLTLPVAASAPVPAALAVVSGASLAFFAFVGFEDLVNLSEEAKRPERTVPRAICLSILISSTIYIGIALVAVSVCDPAKLNASATPLLDVVRTAAPDFPAQLYAVIPGFAVFNTALLNLMMASRLLYGMSRSRARLLPESFGYLHPQWRTPVVGVAISAGIVMTLLICFDDVKTLASGTASFLLAVFVLLHVGLLRIKRRPGEPAPAFRAPSAVPVLGAMTGLLLLARQDAQALKVAGLLTLLALALFGIMRRVRGRVEVEALD